MSWRHYPSADGVHLVPTDDDVEHVRTRRCICGPHVDDIADGRRIITHWSLDGREFGDM